MTNAISGTLMQTPERDRLDIRDVVVVVEESGVIAQVHPRDSRAADEAVSASETHTVLSPTTVLLPGLIDLHVHAPQWPQLGTGLDLPLRDWLLSYTFPLESRFEDSAFAEAVWPDLVRTLLAHGTTTAVYFSSRHLEATTQLASTCYQIGQRAFIGRVAMDHPEETPPSYRDLSASEGVALSASSIAEIRALDPNGTLINPLITPRFTPACTEALLEGLGELSMSTDVMVQTHCSESDWEHEHALDRFGVSDTAALDGFGLLGRGAILAHANLASDVDLRLMAERGVGVAHCPLSNAYFAGSVFPSKRALGFGVQVGLGSDIAGGASASMLYQCHQAVTSSRILEDGVDALQPVQRRGVGASRVDILTAFWMATVGGARALRLPLGLIEVGHHFDAIAVDTMLSGGPLRIWPELDSPERIFEKIVRLAGPREISAVWVAGKEVSPRS